MKTANIGTLKNQLSAYLKYVRSGEEVAVRDRAESLVDRFQLTAAVALQLAAALTWRLGHPRSRPFLSGDAHLLDAARQLGFQGIEG